MTLQALNPKDARVLVVEDSPNDQEIATRALKTYGIRHWQLARRAEDALQEVSKHDYDVIFVDYNLPGMNGLQFLESMRKHRPETRVILVTGAKLESVAVAAMKLGAADYISKDEFLTSGITRALQAALRERVAEAETEQRSILTGAGNRQLQEAQIEMTWLTQALDARHGYAAESQRGRESFSEEWADIVHLFSDYLRGSWEDFPDPATMQEDALLRALIERGVSPREALRLFTAALRELSVEQLAGDNAPVRPILFLTHVLAALVEELQVQVSIQELGAGWHEGDRRL